MRVKQIFYSISEVKRLAGWDTGLILILLWIDGMCSFKCENDSILQVLPLQLRYFPCGELLDHALSFCNLCLENGYDKKRVDMTYVGSSLPAFEGRFTMDILFSL